MNDVRNILKIPQPNYIKIDIDGIEHLILSGGQDVLTKVEGILIEANDDFNEQSEKVFSILTGSGMILIEKRHGAEFDSHDAPTSYRTTFNQIWRRKS